MARRVDPERLSVACVGPHTAAEFAEPEARRYGSPHWRTGGRAATMPGVVTASPTPTTASSSATCAGSATAGRSSARCSAARASPTCAARGPQRERGSEWVVVLVSEHFDGVPWLERVHQAASLWDADEMGAPADVHCYTPARVRPQGDRPARRAGRRGDAASTCWPERPGPARGLHAVAPRRAPGRRWSACTASPTPGAPGSSCCPRWSATTTCWRRRCPATPAGRRSGAVSAGRARRRGRARDGRRGLRDRAPRRQLARRLRRAAARRPRPGADGRRARPGRRLGDGRRVLQRSTLASSAAMQRARRARRRTPTRSWPRRGPAPRDALITALRAHPGRAARPPDARRRGLHGAPRADRVRAARGLRASTPSGSPARCAIVWGTADRLLPWPAAAARFRTRVAAARRLGRARRRRPLPAARRPARDRRS